MFALAETPIRFRAGLVTLPYIAIISDVGSWWLTKLSTTFAGMVLVGGALIGVLLMEAR